MGNRISMGITTKDAPRGPKLDLSERLEERKESQQTAHFLRSLTADNLINNSNTKSTNSD